jgi:15-cis-phytoene synthase
LFAIEDALADTVARSTQPALAAIKLAWWRERLEELDHGEAPAEPRLQAAARELLPRGIGGADLAELEEGWAGLLNEQPDMALLAEHGTRLFALGARLLGVVFDDSTIGVAGRLFAGVDAGRRGIIDVASGMSDTRCPRIPRRARPLTMFAALAARDLRRGGPPFEPEATPGRAWTVLSHRLTGRYPR